MELKSLYTLALLLPVAASCDAWLLEDNPMTNTPADYMTSAAAAGQVINAAYSPMMWEYNNTYYSEFFIGDIVSDDALKGGQNISDMADAYDMENFKTVGLLQGSVPRGCKGKSCDCGSLCNGNGRDFR